MVITSGFFSGGATWLVAGGITLSGAAIPVGNKASKIEVEAKEIAIGALSMIGALVSSKRVGGPRDFIGSFLDAYTYLKGTISYVKVISYKAPKSQPYVLLKYYPSALNEKTQTLSENSILKIEENGVSAEILDFSTPDIIISEEGVIGSRTGSITIKNTGVTEFNATGFITSYISASTRNNMSILYTVPLPSTPLPPKETRKLEFEYYGPSSTWFGTSYLMKASITLVTQSGEVSISSVISTYYIGTSDDITNLRQQSKVLLDGNYGF